MHQEQALFAWCSEESSCFTSCWDILIDVDNHIPEYSSLTRGPRKEFVLLSFWNDANNYQVFLFISCGKLVIAAPTKYL